MSRSKRPRDSRWTPKQARRVLDELERSGLSVRRFAAKRGLGVERVYHWKRRLQGAPRFAELTVRPTSSVGTIEIDLAGGVSLRVVGDSRVDDAIAILSRLPAR